MEDNFSNQTTVENLKNELKKLKTEIFKKTEKLRKL